MKAIPYEIKSDFDGLLLKLIVVEAKQAKGIVQLAHGMIEHKERYLPLMEYVSDNGYICVIHDHRGHGGSIKTSSDLGYFGKNGDKGIVEDVLTVNKFIKEKYPKLPVFLFGHSMGSLVVRAFTKKYDSEIEGLIVSGSPSKNPALGIALVVSRTQRLFCGAHHKAKLIDKLAFGSYNKNFHDTNEPFRWLSTNQENVTAYQNSPLCGYCLTVNGFESLFKLMKETYSKKNWKCKNKGMRVHFIAGRDDPCIINEKSFNNAVKLMKKKGYSVTSTLYDGMRHEIHNETGNEKVFADILDVLENMNAKGEQ